MYKTKIGPKRSFTDYAAGARLRTAGTGKPDVTLLITYWEIGVGPGKERREKKTEENVGDGNWQKFWQRVTRKEKKMVIYFCVGEVIATRGVVKRRRRVLE